MATCHSCPPDDNTFDDRDVYDHTRRYHPEWMYEQWPDGGLVVVDTTLEPNDFGGSP